jgi:hypothetical protein
MLCHQDTHPFGAPSGGKKGSTRITVQVEKPLDADAMTAIEATVTAAGRPDPISNFLADRESAQQG